MAMRKRSGSGSKRQLKEKVISMYEAFFKGVDLTADNPRFWDEFFLLKPNILQLKAEIGQLSTDQLTEEDNCVGRLFAECVEAIGRGLETIAGEGSDCVKTSQTKVECSLQTVCTVIDTLYGRAAQDAGLAVRGVLVAHDAGAVANLILLCRDILLEETADKSLILELLFVIVTGTPDLDSNPLLPDLMDNPLFDPLIQLLCVSSLRQIHVSSFGEQWAQVIDRMEKIRHSMPLATPKGKTSRYDAVVLLTLLVNYRRHESTNPYTAKLSVLDDELALNGYGQVITATLSEHVLAALKARGGGWLSSLRGYLGNMLAGDEPPLCRGHCARSDQMLLALYEATHLNRNFTATLAHSSAASSAPPSPPATLPPHQMPPDAMLVQTLDCDQPTNLLVVFFQYCSVEMGDLQVEARYDRLRLCFVTLLCIAEEQVANSIMYDQILTFKVQLHRLPMRHRKLAPEEPPSQTLAATLIDLLIEFIMCHLLDKFPGELYDLCARVLQRLLAYQKRWRVRLARDWHQLWDALTALLRFLANKDRLLLKTHNIFPLALQVVNIFNLFITLGDTFLPTVGSYDQLYYELTRQKEVFDKLAAMALRYSTGDGPYKADALRLANSLMNVCTAVQHFSLKIDEWKKLNNISTPTEQQILDVIISNYDSLILRYQDSLETYERYSEEQHAPLLTKMRQEAAQRARERLDVYLAASKPLL